MCKDKHCTFSRFLEKLWNPKFFLTIPLNVTMCKTKTDLTLVVSAALASMTSLDKI